MAEIPPLPEGFTLDQQAQGIPPLPEGFTLDQPQQAQEPTLADRGVAVAAGVNRAMAGLAGLPMDTVLNIIDLGKALAGTVYSEATDRAVPQSLQVSSDRSGVPGSSQWFMTDNGVVRPAYQVPREDLPSQRYLAAAGQGTAGALTGRLTGASTRSVLPANVAGAEASQVAADLGADPATQAVAGLAGGATANAGRAGLAEGVKRSFRGGEEGRQTVAGNIAAFEQSGDIPSVGQATQNRRMQATESLLSRTPGSAGVMASRAEDQAANLGAGIERKANSLSPKASAEQAGRAIERGVRGEGGFVENFKAKQKSLYDELDRYVKPQTGVDLSNTTKALEQLNAPIKGAENTSKFFQNAKMRSIEDALKKDLEASGGNPAVADLETVIAGGGKLPYEAVKKLRTLVGNEMADSSILSDVPRSKWKAFYGALSTDMEQAAKAAGPDATAAWNRANNYTRAGMKRLETIDHVIERNGGPEAIFTAATSGTKEGATTLRAVMQSLPEDAQKTVSATVLRRLGRATPGKQNDLGEKFSTETFLTNWNSMSPQAKAVLFDRYGAGFRQDMDQVAKVASNLREGSKVWQNPSGTGQATAQTGAVVAFATSLATGNVGTAGAIAGSVGAANLSARLMNHPPFVKWLAKTTKAPPNAIPSLVNQLATNGSDDEKEFARLYLEQSQQK